MFATTRMALLLAAAKSARYDRCKRRPPDAPKVNGHAYMAACDRVLHHVIEVCHAKGLELSLDIDPGRAPFEVITETHQIHLTYRGVTCVVQVDHDTFMNEGFFQTLVLHRIEAAIEELASGT